MNRLQVAEQFRKALQMFAASLTDEQAMEVATIYDPWVVGKSYAVGDFVTRGENSVGDPQLYKVVQAHTSQADWTPDATPALYTATVSTLRGILCGLSQPERTMRITPEISWTTTARFINL